jgi:hypothetical protein
MDERELIVCLDGLLILGEGGCARSGVCVGIVVGAAGLSGIGGLWAVVKVTIQGGEIAAVMVVRVAVSVIVRKRENVS